MFRVSHIAVAILAAFIFSGIASANDRPSLVLTAQGVAEMRRVKDPAPLYAVALDEAKARVARSIKEGVVVPTPKDPGGGYTHERHKENYKIIHDAGIPVSYTHLTLPTTPYV